MVTDLGPAVRRVLPSARAALERLVRIPSVSADPDAGPHVRASAGEVAAPLRRGRPARPRALGARVHVEAGGAAAPFTARTRGPGVQVRTFGAANDLIRVMAGKQRMPDALRRVDALRHGLPGQPRDPAKSFMRSEAA